jgi:hypothetical protein
MAADSDSELEDRYVVKLADPRHVLNGAVRFFDVMVPYERRYPKSANIPPEIRWVAQHFFIGENDELLSVVGKAEPCADHDTQIGHDPDRPKKSYVTPDQCPGYHYYYVRRELQYLVNGVCDAFKPGWMEIGDPDRRTQKFSIMLLKSEEVNMEDLKTLVRTMSDKGEWYLNRRRNAFTLIYDNRTANKTALTKLFHLTKIYDAIDFVEDIDPVLKKWPHTDVR